MKANDINAQENSGLLERGEEERFRYPGSRPFKQNESKLFWGRGNEISGLLNTVNLERLVVLYARSGLGKSSLINAGFLPKLNREKFLPISIRIYEDNKMPDEIVIEHLLKIVNRRELINPVDPTFWDCCKTIQRVTGKTPLLILDQFEELFNFYNFEDRKKFIKQLAEVVNDILPEAIKSAIVEILIKDEDNVSDQNLKKIRASEEDLHAKVLIAIRSDKLSTLDELSDKIPLILNSRYQLKPLTKVQAKAAIIQPGLSLGDGEMNKPFSSPPFVYDPQVVTSIINFLAREKTEDEYIDTNNVESFQLQILCQYIENEVVNRYEKRILDTTDKSPARKVDKTYLKDEEEMKAVLKNFYENKIMEVVPVEEQEAVRDLIENKLIINGFRNSLSLNEIENTHGVSTATMIKLVNCHLLRHDRRLNQDFYEISHDTLVGPISKSSRKRQSDKHKKAIDELKKDKTELAKKNKRKSYWLYIVSIISIGLITAMIFYIKAVEEKNALKLDLLEEEELSLNLKSSKRHSEYMIDLNFAALGETSSDRTLAFRLAQKAVEEDNENPYALNTYNQIIGETYLFPFYSHAYTGHENDVFDIATMPNGEVFTVSLDGKVMHWPANDSTLAKTYDHGASIFSIAISPKFKNFITAGYKSYLWDLETGEKKALYQKKGYVDACAFSADGRKIALAVRNGTVEFFNESGRSLPTFKLRPNAGSANSLHFLGASKDLIVSTLDSQLLLLNYNKLEKNYKASTGIQLSSRINSLDISGDTMIVGGFNNGTIKVWKIHKDTPKYNPVDTFLSREQQLKEEAYFRFQLHSNFSAHNDLISRVQFSSDGKHILSSSQDRSAKLWTLNGGLLKTFLGHKDALKVAVFQQNDDRVIYTGGEDHSVKKWEIKDYHEFELNAHEKVVKAIEPLDGNAFASGSTDGRLAIWNKKGVVDTTIELPIRDLYSLAWDSKRQRLYFGGRSGIKYIYKKDGLWTKESSFFRKVNGRKSRGLIYVSGLCLLPGGDHLIAVGALGYANIINLEDSTLDILLEGHKDWVYGVDYSQEKKYIITGSKDKNAIIWNLQGEILDTLIGHTDFIRAVAISKDGRFALTGSWDNTMKLWEILSVKKNSEPGIEASLIHTFKGHKSDITTVGFYLQKKNQYSIFSGSSDNSVKLWSFMPESNAVVEQKSLIRHASSVQDVVVSDKGRYLYSASSEHTVKKWDLNHEKVDENFKNVMPLTEKVDAVVEQIKKDRGIPSVDK